MSTQYAHVQGRSWYDPEDTLEAINSPCVSRVRKILHMNRGRRPSMREVASLLCYSRSTLSRRLAEEGYNYRRLIDEYRVSQAKELLIKNELSLASISKILGYGGAAGLNRTFKRLTRMTMTEFRRSCFEDVCSI